MGAAICRRWTSDEKEYVYDKWGIESVKLIAKKINRTEYAIIRFAERERLGCSRTANGLYCTTIEVADLLKVDPTTVIEWIEKGWLKAKFTKIIKRHFYRISLDDLVKFMKNNPERWKASNVELYALGEEYDWLKEKRITDSNITVKKQGTTWTTKEVKLLEDYIKHGFSSREIAKKLNRTYKSVRAKRQKLRTT